MGVHEVKIGVDLPSGEWWEKPSTWNDLVIKEGDWKVYVSIDNFLIIFFIY